MLFINRALLKNFSTNSYILLYILLNLFTPKALTSEVNEYKISDLENNIINREIASNFLEDNSFEYIIGPGDVLYIEVEGIDALSGNVAIEPDGYIFFPEVGSLLVENMTINEFKSFFTSELSKYIINPKVYIRPEAYRPLKVFILGEVTRSGYYTLNGYQSSKEDLIIPLKDLFKPETPSEFAKDFANSGRVAKRGDNIGLLFPTVYDAIIFSPSLSQFVPLTVTRAAP